MLTLCLTEQYFLTKINCMSQSATLYRISQGTFIQLENLGNDTSFDMSSANSCVTFEGSFLGLTYVLSKNRNDLDQELINGIFNPAKLLGAENVESLPFEDQFELYDSEGLIQYQDPLMISSINRLLNGVSETDFGLNYDAKELNDNEVYPYVWHNDNSADKIFNKRHLLEEFIELKSFLLQAEKEQDYILVFVG